MPLVIRHSIRGGLVAQSFNRQPERRQHPPLAVVLPNQHERGQVSGRVEDRAHHKRHAFERPDRTPAGGPYRGRDEGVAGLDPLVQDQISNIQPRAPACAWRLPPWRAPRAVHEGVEGRVSDPDRRLGERIELGRRRIELHHGARVVAGQGVVDEDGEEIASVGACVEMMIESGASCAAVAVSSASYKLDRGPLHCPSSS